VRLRSCDPRLAHKKHGKDRQEKIRLHEYRRFNPKSVPKN